MLKLVLTYSFILPLFLNYVALDQKPRDPDRPAPVEVSEVSLEDKGSHFIVSKLKLKNRSAKTIRAIKFNWQLIERSADSEIILRKGLDTNFIQLPKDLEAGAELELERTTIKIDKMLLRVNLDSNRRIELLASNVIYADGSMWRPSVRVIPL